jgi:alkanesulfonate monooxygenase SsuD/methylene tetrahydromethanopterin reductase-like flavin-dependent oxidoreductase (luciferase family)
VRFGATTIPNVTLAELTETWHALDAHELVESVWVPDHTFEGWIAAWDALPTLADVTGRVSFGPLVSPATAHDPETLASKAHALDDGRLELGIGSGGDWRNFAAWTERLVPLLGRIPLTVGGTADTQLRVAAKHASRWNYSPQRHDTLDGARAKGRELNARLDELTDQPVRSALIAYPFTAENDTPLEELADAWAEAGFDELILDPWRFTEQG